mmetsp:Transcript_13739/g.54374  ORF Transcript_13739/g.54374 Transcript_13739/m.54374 type:complete len:217 (-) Transcript_13739:128-778(-)
MALVTVGRTQRNAASKSSQYTLNSSSASTSSSSSLALSALSISSRTASPALYMRVWAASTASWQSIRRSAATYPMHFFARSSYCSLPNEGSSGTERQMERSTRLRRATDEVWPPPMRTSLSKRPYLRRAGSSLSASVAMPMTTSGAVPSAEFHAIVEAMPSIRVSSCATIPPSYWLAWSRFGHSTSSWSMTTAERQALLRAAAAKASRSFFSLSPT